MISSITDPSQKIILNVLSVRITSEVWLYIIKLNFTWTSPSIIKTEKRRIHLNLWGHSPFLLEFHQLKSKWKILSPVKFEIEDFLKRGAFIKIQMSSKCWVKHYNKTHSARDSWALPTYHIPGRLSI